MKLHVADAINRETAMMAVKSWYESPARMHSRYGNSQTVIFHFVRETREIEINNRVSHIVYARVCDG